MLTISQAIRIGSLIHPQCFGATRNKVRGGLLKLFRETEATCAWGAAHEAGGTQIIEVKITEDFIPFRGYAPLNAGETVLAYQTPPEWSPVARRWDICPKCRKEDYVERLIAHLNDDHRWRRELIADWVETIESEISHESQCMVTVV